MTSINRIFFVLASGLGLALASGAAVAQVVNSKHDLTSTNVQGGVGVAGTTQVCVFCHTPHGSATAAPVPLWNKVLSAPGSYTRYSAIATPSFDSQEAPVGSVSLACLSCHDGTQAMDVVLNSPGSGGYNAAGAEFDTVNVAAMTGAPVPMLGTDLRNDHPVSMQYGGGGPTAADADGTFGGTLGDPDFNAPVKATINAQPIWWVDSAVGTQTGVREKADMLLYTRDDLGTQQPFVECGSCHDPHNSSTAGAGSVAFLRINNDNSQICTTCHTK